VPVDIRLLDFQIIRYSSPVLDLSYCIFGSTTKELRDKHYFEFLDVYHQTLSEHITRQVLSVQCLSNFQDDNERTCCNKIVHIFIYFVELDRLGSDPEKLFPKSAFNEHLSKFGKFGLASGIFLIPIITSAAEDAIDLDDISEKMRERSNGNEEVSITEDLNFEKTGNYKIMQKRMIGVVEDICNLGYI
jgi:Ecdysteroid kinase-like family